MTKKTPPTGSPGPRKHSGTDDASSRRRASRSGSRSVNTLSTTQLERKRANDREAQRTIRQRTKEHIHILERQVAHLGVREAQLESVMQRNAVLEAELARLKQQMLTAGYDFGRDDMPELYETVGAMPSSYPNGKSLSLAARICMTDCFDCQPPPQ